MGVRNPNERAPVRHTARYRETRFQSTLSEAEPVGGEIDLHFNDVSRAHSGASPEPEQRAAWADSWVGIGKDQMGHSLSHGGRRCLSADVPNLVGRIGSNDEKV
jgi:hypothetical protein